MKIKNIMEDLKLSPTLEKLKNHVEQIMISGGPKNKEETEIVNIWNRLNGGKAFNAGKRKDTYIKKQRVR